MNDDGDDGDDGDDHGDDDGDDEERVTTTTTEAATSAAASGATTSSAAAPAPTDPAGTFVGEVHVVVEGEGPGVALLHGIPGSTRDFRYLGPALAERGFTAVRIDLPGFGKTPARAFRAPEPKNRATFVRQVMRSLGFHRFSVGGHSFGGGTATMCAALFPLEVDALLLMNSIGPRRHRGAGPVPPPLVRVLARSMDLPLLGRQISRVASSAYAARGLKSDIPLTHDVVQHHARVIGAFSFEEMRVICRMVRCPVLVASSEDDPLVEPPCSFALVRALAGAPLVTHFHEKSGGHFAQKFQARAIARWLTSARDATRAPALHP